jgi:hypothetical protein
VEKMKLHMTQLHRYNENKDAAQAILGELAVLEGKTLKQIYQDLDVPYTSNDD